MINCPRCDKKMETPYQLEYYADNTSRYYTIDPMVWDHSTRENTCYWCACKEYPLLLQGYIESKIIDKEIGYTELAMHVGIAGKRAKMVRRIPGKSGYGYVLDEDGVWTGGAMSEFEDTINVS